MKITVINEHGQGHVNPDLCWQGSFADLVLAGPEAANNRGAFVAEQEIRTAVIICLMTDIAVDESELRDGDTQRGWPGDGFDLQGMERSLGSKLWLLRRSTVDAEQVPLLAEQYAKQALDTLIEQGVCVRVDAEARAVPAENRLELGVSLFGREGARVFQDKFSILWEQVDNVSQSLD
jgi:phage gp46-like protein